MKFLRGSTDGCIVFNDVVRERDARSSGRPFKTETSPCNYCLWQYMQGRGGQNAISRGGAGKGYAKRCKIKIPPSIRGAAMPWREWWISIYLYAIFIFTIKMIH